MSQCILACLPSPSHNSPCHPWLSTGILRVYKPGGSDLAPLQQLSKHFCSGAQYYSVSTPIYLLEHLWHVTFEHCSYPASSSHQTLTFWCISLTFSYLQHHPIVHGHPVAATIVISLPTQDLNLWFMCWDHLSEECSGFWAELLPVPPISNISTLLPGMAYKAWNNCWSTQTTTVKTKRNGTS